MKGKELHREIDTQRNKRVRARMIEKEGTDRKRETNRYTDRLRDKESQRESTRERKRKRYNKTQSI